MDSSLWAAALHDLQLASEYETWSGALTKALATRLDPVAASIAAHCLDGFLLRCALRDRPPSYEELLAICRRLVSTDTSTGA